MHPLVGTGVPFSEVTGAFSTQEEIWPAVAPTIRDEFWQVLDSARKPNDFENSGVFTPAEERIIRIGLQKLFRKRRLRAGDEIEIEISQKLRRLLWAT